MWWRGEPKKIFAYGGSIDMRCSFDGLVVALIAHLGADPLTGDFNVFVNRRRSLLKGVFWDRIIPS
jgi:transposase